MTEKFIIGAYPSAPSFHYLNKDDEIAFFNKLCENPHIGGLEQPCLEEFHPLGNDFLFRTIPEDWQVVVTSIMYTTKTRMSNGAFGLASIDENGRKAAMKYFEHVLNQMALVTDKFGQRFKALMIQSAPLLGNKDVEKGQEAFSESLKDLSSYDVPCPVIIEHCDSFEGLAPKKGYLPLKTEIELAKHFGLGICINWARSVLEGGNDINTPVEHISLCAKEHVLSGLMFSGTAKGGEWGAFQDNHAPLAPFSGSRLNCKESLMTIAEGKRCAKTAGASSLLFKGAKLLEIDPKAGVAHRADILLDGVDALAQIFEEV